MDWHSLSVDEVLRKLRTGREGLDEDEARRRLEEYGLNELVSKKKSPIMIFAKQFTNFLILILIVSAVIAWFLGEVVDAAAILLIVAIMGVAGFLQEFRAEKAAEALKRMATPYAKVIRGGRIKEIPAHEVVPGDIIVIGEGDRIPADARLISAEELLVDESPLTGESEPVRKNPDVILEPDTPVSERVNMLFMGTHAVSGKALAVVVATGMRTELGKIAESLSKVEERKTLLEEELDRLGKRLGIIILAISAFVFISSVYVTHMSPINALILAIALAVAAIPEGLPAVATSVLAIGAYRMSKKNVIVRELGAIEALGACDVIASDKTGTITKGEMTVKLAWCGGREYVVEGTGYEPVGKVIPRDGKGGLDRRLKELAEMLVKHIRGDVDIVHEGDSWRVRGSPTEGAALVFAMKVLGTDVVDRIKRELVRTYPFDRFRKRKTTVHLTNDSYLVISSGAPEMLLDISNSVVTEEGVKPLTPELRRSILDYIASIASKGYRTYGVAYRVMGEEPPDDVRFVEREMTFVAVLGIIDPPREGVREAVEEVRKAGIKVIMITGDHRLTAKAVAEMIGLDVSGERSIIDGKELDSMSDEELREIIDDVVVFARVTPEHKRRIVNALRAKGHVVAMTGDGVNDAPALKEADIGIAMGIRGTDVAKEVAKLILKDDNFVTIVEAVKEGRVIYENLKKPINYLLPANIGEVATIFMAELAGLPPPLDAPQLLWINVTTDSLPALALSVEPAEPDIMQKPPRRRKSSFITNRKIAYFTILGTAIGTVNLVLFSSVLSNIGLAEARTLVFTAIAFSEFGRALSSRSETKHFWYRPFNKWLLPALLASVSLQLFAVYTPGVRELFTAVPLPLWLLGTALLTAVPVLLIDEVRKTLKIRV